MTSNRSLLYWIFSLDTENTKQHLPITDDSHYKLADGFICARVLNQISPKHFTDKWLDGIKAVPPNGSWRLRFSNLKRIFQKISDYANDVLSDQFRPVYPNVEVIAQNFDPEQISKLVQLVLCCAVNCEQKNDYINKILTLPEQIQRDIKEAIQELLLVDTQDNQDISTSKDHIKQQSALIGTQTVQANDTSDVMFDISNATPLLNRLSRTNRRDSAKSSNNERNPSFLDATHNLSSTSRQEQKTILTMNEENIQAVYDLEIKLKQSQLEKDQLQAENDKLMLDFKTINSSPRKLSRASQGALELNFTEDRFSHHRANEDDDDAFKLVAQVEKLQKEVLRMKADLAISDAEKEESKLKTSLLQRDLIEMQTKNQELKHKAEQAKRLQDELDEFRHMSERVTDSETKVEFLHHKIEELRKENKLLEDKNITNFEKILSLEDKNKKLEIAVSQVDRYKRQLQEIQSKLIIETHRADKLEVEMVTLNDNHQVVKAENEKLSNIVKDLKRNKSNSDIKMMFKFDDVLNKFNSDKYDCNSIVDLKARLTQLEIENKFLHSKTANDEKGLKVLMDSLLEESALRCSTLESENRKLKKQLMIMEAKYRDQTASTPSSNNPQLERESSCENNISLANRIEDLQRKLFQREQELMDSEIKNKRNIQKAKEMLKKLETNPTAGERPSYSSSTSSFNSNSIDEFGLLRQQIKEYERQLIDKEREFSQYRKLKELHERLMVSAFYNLVSVNLNEFLLLFYEKKILTCSLSVDNSTPIQISEPKNK